MNTFTCILKDNVPGAPLWLNEGLAELYGSMQFSGDEAAPRAKQLHPAVARTGVVAA